MYLPACVARLIIGPLLYQVRFLSPIYHLNVCPATGHVCLGFLSEETWLPTRCVQEVLSALFALLVRPEPEIAADQPLLNIYNQNRIVYEEKAKKAHRKLSDVDVASTHLSNDFLQFSLLSI